MDWATREAYILIIYKKPFIKPYILKDSKEHHFEIALKKKPLVNVYFKNLQTTFFILYLFHSIHAMSTK